MREVIKQPLHPYTQGLMGAIPSITGDAERLVQIPGSMPRLSSIPRGCAFNPRCAKVFDRCRIDRPELIDVGGHQVACHLYDQAQGAGRQDGDRGVSDKAFVQVRDLKRVFDVSRPWLNRVLERQDKQFLKAVDGVSFDIRKGETFALVGESGSGKSTVARMVGRPAEPVRRHGPRSTASSMSDAKASQERQRLRKRIQMIFQDPYASLNPRWRVGRIIAEPIHAFGIIQGDAAIAERVGELLSLVGLHPDDAKKFPHEFSGGQRQRIAIARALASNAEFIVCDEPTSALDVSVQAQILNLMRDLQQKFGLTYLFISHNLAVVRHIGDAHRRDVSRAPGRGLRWQAALRRAAPSLYQDAARRGARPRHGRQAARRREGRDPEPDQPAFGLHLPSALPAGPSIAAASRTRR